MIQEIKEEELAKCLKVIRESYNLVAEQFKLTKENCPKRGHADLTLEELKKQYIDGIKMYGYYDNNIIVGFISLKLKDDSVKIKDIVILPNYQNKGIGTKMLNYAKKKTLEYNKSKIELGMIADNKKLKEWYEHNDFILTSTHQFPEAPFVTGYMECKLK